MFPPLQWDKLHLKIWSRLKGRPFQGHVQFGVDYDLVQYENKIGTTKGIHLLKFKGEKNLEGVQKPS
jgi:hypothetical protein